jgi:hypothetical protein
VDGVVEGDASFSFFFSPIFVGGAGVGIRQNPKTPKPQNPTNLK